MRAVFLNQPEPFYLIFFLEFWERFGFYTVQGILAYFFVKELGFAEVESFYTFGAFSALLYGLVSVGGFIGDKFFGTKRTIVLGMIILAAGYLFLSAATKETVFYALGLICVGNGLFKANPSSLLAKCYKPNDERLHGGFTLYYMAINVGSIFALVIGPTVSSRFGWHLAFFISFVGLVMALANYAYCRKTIASVNHGADKQPFSLKKLLLLLVMVVLLTIACAYLLKHVVLTERLLVVISLAVFAMFLYYAYQETGQSRAKMFVALVLMIEAIVFFTLYQQMPTSLNFFAIHNVEHSLLGLQIDAQTFQVLNPLWIMLLSPILASLYMKLHRMNKDLNLAHKFALGMSFCGISFTLLYFTRFFANEASVVSSWWLVASYFFQSLGELLVSALGVAMVAELVPAAINGFIMGMWFLTSSIAGFTGAYVASFTAAENHLSSNHESLLTYSHVFLQIGLVTLGLSAVMWLTSPFLSRVIDGKVKKKDKACNVNKAKGVLKHQAT